MIRYVIRMFKVSRKLTYTRVLLVKAGLTTNGGYGMDKPGADSVSTEENLNCSHTLSGVRMCGYCVSVYYTTRLPR